MPPSISVILPVFNAACFIKEAVESVQRQSLSNLELIIVDDQSTDGSTEIVRQMQNDPRIRCYSQSHSGAAAARNHGISLASGEFLAFLDADDVWVEQKLEKQMAAIECKQQPDMVFGHYCEFHGALTETADQGLPGYSSGTMLIRRDAFLKVGPFSTKWRVGEYIDWYARAQEQGLKEAIISEVLLYRRVHSQNTGLRYRDARIDYARILSATIQRRRSQKIYTQ